MTAPEAVPVFGYLNLGVGSFRSIEEFDGIEVELGISTTIDEKFYEVALATHFETGSFGN